MSFRTIWSDLVWYIILKGAWNPKFYMLSPISTYCIVPTTEISGLLYADWYCASIEPIRSFLTGQGSRHDSETSWLLDVRTKNNMMDTFILSQKTKRSVLEAKWDRPSRTGHLRIRPVFERTEQGTDRAGQDRTGPYEDRRACFLWL